MVVDVIIWMARVIYVILSLRWTILVVFIYLFSYILYLAFLGFSKDEANVLVSLTEVIDSKASYRSIEGNLPWSFS